MAAVAAEKSELREAATPVGTPPRANGGSLTLTLRASHGMLQWASQPVAGLPRKRKIITPPRLDPCVPKGGANKWGLPPPKRAALIPLLNE